MNDSVNEVAPNPFQECPQCGSSSVMRLVEGWNDGRSITIVGCGNPWHYDLPDARRLDQEGAAR